ncbi:hypothetical protein HJC10_03245 [Corallococcus exiguus]|nr:hypothetical protein [Corallococcus exiguus]
MAPVVRKARPKWMEDDVPSPDKVFFAWTQEERCRRFPGAIPEAPPPGWATWYAGALAAVGGDEWRLRAAWLAWLEDTWGQSRQPVCAARAFVGPEVWRRHVPGQAAPAATLEDTQPAVPDSPARLVWGQVLAELRAEGKRYAVEQLGKLRPDLDGEELLLVAQDRFVASGLDADYGALVRAALTRTGGAVGARFVAPRGTTSRDYHAT